MFAGHVLWHTRLEVLQSVFLLDVVNAVEFLPCEELDLQYLGLV